MSGPVVFPMTARPNGNGPGDVVPLLPIRLRHGGVSADVTGLVDTGSTFSAIPYDLGMRFGLDWNAFPVAIRLGGVLGGMPAKVVLFEGTVLPFPPAPLIFGWAQSNAVPVTFGMANLFLEFDVCFFRARGEFHVSPRTP